MKNTNTNANMNTVYFNFLEEEKWNERAKGADYNSSQVILSDFGLNKLAYAGVDYYEEKTGQKLPYNLIGGRYDFSQMVSREEAEEKKRKYMNFRDWLVKAAGLPAVRKLISKTQCVRGINSPYTIICLWELVREFPSPNKLEKLLWATKKRAEEILSAYKEDIKPSWADILSSLRGEKKIGKAAVITVAKRISTDSYYGNRNMKYNEARDFLVTNRKSLYQIQVKEGLYRKNASYFDKEGISFFEGLKINKYQTREKVWIAIKDGEVFETYHKLDIARKMAKDHFLAKEMVKKIEFLSIEREIYSPWDGRKYAFSFRVNLKLKEKKGSLVVGEYYSNNRVRHDISEEIFKKTMEAFRNESQIDIMELLSEVGFTQKNLIKMGLI